MSDSDDILRAERDAALSMLDGLERVLTRIGGFLEPTDQIALRAARAYLVERGVRQSDAPPVWRDRVNGHAIANGTNPRNQISRQDADRVPSPAAWRLRPILVRGVSQVLLPMALGRLSEIFGKAANLELAVAYAGDYLEMTFGSPIASSIGEVYAFEVLRSPK